MEEIGLGARKFCHGCKTWHAVGEFSFKDAARRLLRSKCRRCCRERSRRHYVLNKTAYLQRNRRRKPLDRRVAAETVLQYLREHPCARCGETDPVVLEFNHLEPQAKLANVSEMIQEGVSKSRLAAEIAKCEVLCANCHQRHTISARRAHYKIVASTRGPSWRLAANRRNGGYVLKRLSTASCVDCGLTDPLVLQFDHRAGEVKVKDIGWFISSGSALRHLAAELLKCDVRCANCHRRRTAIERGWFRALASA